MSSLTDVRVVSMALNVPGPLAVARLRDEGASVLKIEPPTGDPLEEYCPAWYTELHHGIAIERIDLKSADGKTRMRERLADAQLFVSSQRPAALVRLGLDPHSLATDRRTAHLRTLNIVGDRAHPEEAGHDLTYVAGSGLLGGELPRTLLADVMGGERAFAAAVLLLREPLGTHTSIGLADSLAPLIAPLRHGFTQPGGTLGGGLPAYGVYPARDGSVAVAALEPHFRRRLYHALALPLDSPLGNEFLTRTAGEWEAWGREHDVPIAVVR